MNTLRLGVNREFGLRLEGVRLGVAVEPNIMNERMQKAFYLRRREFLSILNSVAPISTAQRAECAVDAPDGVTG